MNRWALTAVLSLAATAIAAPPSPLQADQKDPSKPPKIYVVPFGLDGKGQMGTDIHSCIYEKVVKDIKAKKPDLVIISLDSAERGRREYSGAERDSLELQHLLCSVPGIGPWTATGLAQHVLGDPDAVLLGDLHILDENMQPVPKGTSGEIWFKTGSPFEYFNDPARTAESRSPDGSMSTVGDVGYVDDDAYARMRARDLGARGYGARRVEETLRHAGVGEGLRRAHAPGEAAGRRAAALMAQKKRLGPFGARAEGLDPLAARKAHEKAVAAMLRAGHQYDHVKAVLAARSSAELEEWIAEAQEAEGTDEQW
jgi:regulatory protein